MNEFLQHDLEWEVAPPACGDTFHATESWVERIVVVTAIGELDMFTAPALAHAVQVAARHEPAAMIVDLTEVNFLASAGLNLLVDAHRKVTTFARFAIVADGRATSRPLMLTGIDNVMTVYRSLDVALASVLDA